MKRIIQLPFFLLLLVILPGYAQDSLKDRLKEISVTVAEALPSDHYNEKYLLRLSQPVDPTDPSKGTFEQRVVLCHVGFDKPMVMVTEGYGGSYALRAGYQEELSKLFDTNVLFVEHRYFGESVPDPLDWTYLTAENAAWDLHQVNMLLRPLYSGKWISTGISKGGENSLIYRAYFPDDVDFSVPYVGPLNRKPEDPRHETFLRKVGTKKERERIKDFQLEVFKRKEHMIPLLEEFQKEKQLTFSVPLGEVFDLCVLEYPFALWQWGTPVSVIPLLRSDHKTLFDHLMSISGADYFSCQPDIAPFFVQAARELGYYGYDTRPFKKYLTRRSVKGYVERVMLPEGVGKIEYSNVLYKKLYAFLKENDPKMIFIYGEVDPWSATRVPAFKNKQNTRVYIQPRGSHRARITNMPDDMKFEIIALVNQWLTE